VNVKIFPRSAHLTQECGHGVPGSRLVAREDYLVTKGWGEYMRKGKFRALPSILCSPSIDASLLPRSEMGSRRARAWTAAAGNGRAFRAGAHSLQLRAPHRGRKKAAG